MDIRKIFEYALQREHEGKRFFEENASRLQNAASVGAFKAIALEEQRHIEYIQAQLRALADNSPPSSLNSPPPVSSRTALTAKASLIPSPSPWSRTCPSCAWHT